MTFFVLLFCIQIVSVFFVYISLKRLYAYIKVYRFDESVYTLLFGFLRLRYFVWLYMTSVTFAVLMELFFAFSFLAQ